MNRDELPEKNATCKLCGEAYYVCVRCVRLKDQGIYGWKLFCDSPDCYAMYTIVQMYQDGELTKAQAKERISARFDDAIPKATPEMQRVIAEIMQEETPQSKRRKRGTLFQ